jgi:hypothetical protein
MDLPNRPAVLFLNGDGVEQSGKRTFRSSKLKEV